MKLRLLLPLVLLAAALSPSPLRAQGTTRKAHVPVLIDGTHVGWNYQIIAVDDTGWVTLADNTASGYGTFSQTLSVTPGKVYSVFIQSSYGDIPPTGWADFISMLKAPEGYTIYSGVEAGVQPTMPTRELNGDAYLLDNNNCYTSYFQIVETGVLSAVQAGKLTRLEVGDFIFELSLGSLKNGHSAGRLQLRHDGRTSGGGYGLPVATCTYTSLNLVGAQASGLTWQSLSSGRRLETGQVRVEVVQNTSTKFTASYYVLPIFLAS